MPITIHEAGTTITGAAGMNLYRLLTLRQGLMLEMKGLRMTRRAPACSTIIRNELGFRGKKDAQLKQLDDYIEVINKTVARINAKG